MIKAFWIYINEAAMYFKLVLVISPVSNTAEIYKKKMTST